MKPMKVFQVTNRRSLIVCTIMSLLMLVMLASTINAKEYETPGNRNAADILPEKMLTGSHYRIRNKVVSYGYMHNFNVESDFGAFKVAGDGALRKLLNEINAIAKLRKIKKSDAFGEAAKNAAKQPVEFGKNLITEPVDTISGVPKGVFRIFSNAYESITSPKDPSEDSRTKTILAVSSHKRQLAYELGVDVYSSNPVLQEDLNSIGWAGSLGSLSVSAALAPFGGPGAKAVKATRLAQQLNNMLKDNSPSRLRKINEEKLRTMFVQENLVKEFLDSPAFTPRHDTIIVGSLEKLKGARGRDMFINFALTARDEESANFFQNVAETTLGYHETVSPIREITVNSDILIAKAKNGAVLIPFPLDHGVWTQRADRIISNLVNSYNRTSGTKNIFELWVTGTLSPMAKKELKSLGINVTENVDERIKFIN